MLRFSQRPGVGACRIPEYMADDMPWEGAATQEPSFDSKNCEGGALSAKFETRCGWVGGSIGGIISHGPEDDGFGICGEARPTWLFLFFAFPFIGVLLLEKVCNIGHG